MQRKGRARPLGAPENAKGKAGSAKTRSASAAKRTPRTARRSVPTIEELRVSAFKIPTDQPESDGTYKWDSTTIVIVEAEAGGEHSLGYGYADEATAHLIESKLKKVVLGRDALSVSGSFVAMVESIRNLGGWVEKGIPRVKMKVGRDPKADPERVAAAREAIGNDAELFVDANGAYSRKQALELAYVFSELDVSWFEEPVSSDDLAGLHLMRDDGPPGMNIAAGEYGYDITYFQRMLAAEAVDVLQADATRCGGFTGFFQASALCEAHHIPLSSHCAPALHIAAGCSARPFRHAEYFHDHVRIENMLFEGVPQPENGALKPDLSRTGLGLEFKRSEAERFRIL